MARKVIVTCKVPREGGFKKPCNILTNCLVGSGNKTRLIKLCTSPSLKASISGAAPAAPPAATLAAHGSRTPAAAALTWPSWKTPRRAAQPVGNSQKLHHQLVKTNALPGILSGGGGALSGRLQHAGGTALWSQGWAAANRDTPRHPASGGQCRNGVLHRQVPRSATSWALG